MSQTLLPDSDVLVTIFLPNPASPNLASGGTETANEGPVASSSPFLSFLLQTPLTEPGENTNISIAFIFSVDFSATMEGGGYTINVTHPTFGIIPELSESVPSGEFVAIPYFKSITLDDLMAEFSTTPAIFFALPLEISFTSFASEINPGVPGSLTVSFGSFEFFVPDEAGAALEITGDGGMEVNSEALTVPVSYTGEGGVEVGDGGVDTPLVLSANISGLYTLVNGQYFDRVYTRNVNPDDTTDVAIPEPFGKTAFLGG